jgi:hypothetical protein
LREPVVDVPLTMIVYSQASAGFVFWRRLIRSLALEATVWAFVVVVVLPLLQTGIEDADVVDDGAVEQWKVCARGLRYAG